MSLICSLAGSASKFSELSPSKLTSWKSLWLHWMEGEEEEREREEERNELG